MAATLIPIREGPHLGESQDMFGKNILRVLLYEYGFQAEQNSELGAE